MLSSLLDGARRSLRRPHFQESDSGRYDGPAGASSRPDMTRSQSWAHYDRNVDDDDGEDGGELTQDDAEDTGFDGQGNQEEEDDDEEDELEDAPLLPIFESSRLDSLPVYNLTHAIRLLIVPKCETTLSWDQLRSPQISQFMVKPIQKEILEHHFSRATIYALLANCLQFSKEGDANPAIIGVSRTRGMVCELLAVRLLKEYSTRELIDVLSYDFFPLQGMTEAPQTNHHRKPQAARTSTLEVAIRASAKRFLAHPLVVQQLEAIWAGTIVFHHAADAAHRRFPQLPQSQYGTIDSGTTARLMNSDSINTGTTHGRQHDEHEPRKDTAAYIATRRTVTLYDPREASLFKLSRLRVPRYRHFVSTCSLAVFLGLFVGVLSERSLEITPLEIAFWFWSAGYMLDEVVGFNEQGFSLYILSIWNAFDIGILLLLVCFYALRLYGILLLDVHKQKIADLAFDILAANAIILFPRLFSILDHYRYFSQLLIAFRMMAQDLMAVLVLIVISCSGFFVAFTLSFGGEGSPAGVAFGLFKLLMGFTPTAWDLWGEYNFIGRALLIIFLVISHFLVITILVTVLTNSFMSIVQNANDEHQFLFAVNTISMVKSDSLFSYIAPSNILGWLITPLRYLLPFRRFVWVNRTVIKLTHFPVLLAIFVYERLILRRIAYQPTEMIERGRRLHRLKTVNSAIFFSPREPKLREPSAATFHKDRALAEVFRRPYQDDTYGKGSHSRTKRASVVVDTWMQGMGSDGGASPPDEQDRAIVDRLERPRGIKKSWTKRLASGVSMGTRSLAASDPEDFGGAEYPFPVSKRTMKSAMRRKNESTDRDDGDGDDELVTNDGDEQETIDERSIAQRDGADDDDTPRRMLTPGGASARPPYLGRHSSISFAESSPLRYTPPIKRGPYSRPSFSRPETSRRVPAHKREISVQTVLFNPSADEENTSPTAQKVRHLEKDSTVPSSTTSSPTNGKRGKAKQPRLRGDKNPVPTPPRLIMPVRGAAQSTPNTDHFLQAPNTSQRRGQVAESTFSPSPPASSVPAHQHPRHRQLSAYHSSYPNHRSSDAMAFDLASDLGDNKAAVSSGIGGMPASFATQLAFADRLRRMKSVERREEREEDDRRMSKLVLARMNTLEEGFREMLKEVKDMKGTDAHAKKKKNGNGNGHGLGPGRGNSIVSAAGSAGLRSGLATPALRSGQATALKGTSRTGAQSGASLSAMESDAGEVESMQVGVQALPQLQEHVQKWQVEARNGDEEWEDEQIVGGGYNDDGAGPKLEDGPRGSSI